ncbi:MAG: S8 family serine peptidase [Planctomycetes bacterium]|nr:S8 family serine peptidase [Planctomycetota bacterium]MBL7008338.1 S8 family serine peptidase [Planctomycetota bacterium]
MLTTFLAFSLLLPQAVPQPEVISAELRQVIEVAPLEQHRVYALMADRLDYADFAGRVEQLARGDRQRFVMDELRAHADLAQAPLRDLLQDLESQGHVSRVNPLWIVNGVQLSGDAEAIRRLAAVPGVSRISYDPDRDPNELQDVPLAAMIQQAARPGVTGGGRAVSYYSEDFESGAFGPEWSTATTATGRVQVTTLHGPHQGSYHVVMDSSLDGSYGSASMTLTVDLSAASTAQLRYAFLDLYDEFNLGSDILEASDDGGLSWTKVADLNGANGTYLVLTHDLDLLGLSYVSNFKLRWSWYDNYSAPTDGFGFDLIELADSFPPPPPPAPEPNLVKHQAPDLWSLGVTGAGVVLLNIDSGTDRNHPDLANRIWTNPLDPIDGIDNDGNGYIDDYWGWNFAGNNNNPSGGGHGTNTAGIMVGDGSSGVRLTGMAPRAWLAVCQLGNESDHWASLQWGLSVGVDCSSSSYSYKWPFSPRPDYFTHRAVSEGVLAAGQIHANSIGNQGGLPTYPIPFNISAPGNVPGPWVHPQQVEGGIAAVLGCCGVNLADDSYYTASGHGPSAWEDITLYDPAYPHVNDPAMWDYPAGGWSVPQPGLLKPDIAGYTSGPMTTSDGGGYTSFSGTSCATPHIGGASALLISANPAALPRQISQALQENAWDRGPAGKDIEWGTGVAKVYDAGMRVICLATAADLEPQAGSANSVTVTGPPLARYGLFYGRAKGATAIGVYGTLEIANAKLLSTGTLNAAGSDVVTGTIPNNPALYDKPLYVQAVCDDTGGATGAYLHSLVETMIVRP